MLSRRRKYDRTLASSLDKVDCGTSVLPGVFLDWTCLFGVTGANKVAQLAPISILVSMLLGRV